MRRSKAKFFLPPAVAWLAFFAALGVLRAGFNLSGGLGWPFYYLIAPAAIGGGLLLHSYLPAWRRRTLLTNVAIFCGLLVAGLPGLDFVVLVYAGLLAGRLGKYRGVPIVVIAVLLLLPWRPNLLPYLFNPAQMWFWELTSLVILGVLSWYRRATVAQILTLAAILLAVFCPPNQFNGKMTETGPVQIYADTGHDNYQIADHHRQILRSSTASQSGMYLAALTASLQFKSNIDAVLLVGMTPHPLVDLLMQLGYVQKILLSSYAELDDVQDALRVDSPGALLQFAPPKYPLIILAETPVTPLIAKQRLADLAYQKLTPKSGVLLAPRQWLQNHADLVELPGNGEWAMRVKGLTPQTDLAILEKRLQCRRTGVYWPDGAFSEICAKPECIAKSLNAEFGSAAVLPWSRRTVDYGLGEVLLLYLVLRFFLSCRRQNFAGFTAVERGLIPGACLILSMQVLEQYSLLYSAYFGTLMLAAFLPAARLKPTAKDRWQSPLTLLLLGGLWYGSCQIVTLSSWDLTILAALLMLVILCETKAPPRQQRAYFSEFWFWRKLLNGWFLGMAGGAAALYFGLLPELLIVLAILKIMQMLKI